MWKHFLVLGLLLTVIVGYVFWRIHSTQDTTPSSVTVAERFRSGEPDKASRLRQMAREAFTEEQPLSDYRQKKLAIMETPEYEAFIEAGSKRLYATLDFFASQGLETDKSAFSQVFEKKFREHFPGETPASAEPQVRQELIDRLDERAAEEHLQVAMAFVAEARYNAWGNLYFETDDAAFGQWAFDILKNYHLPAEVPAVAETEETVSVTQPSTDTDASLGDFPSTESSVVPEALIQDPTVLEVDGVFTESDIDINAEIQKLLDSLSSDTVAFYTEADLGENLVQSAEGLHEDFSPKRFNAAMQTLRRYGPEEGFRRLKESDPEFATHIEHYIRGEEER